VPSPPPGQSDSRHELEALVQESERLQQCSAELLEDMEALRGGMAQLYIDMAPFDDRRGEQPYPYGGK
jgi:hypothetical protein